MTNKDKAMIQEMIADAVANALAQKAQPKAAKKSTRKATTPKAQVQVSQPKARVTAKDFNKVDPSKFAPKDPTDYASVQDARNAYKTAVTGRKGWVDCYKEAVAPWDAMYGTWDKSAHALVKSRKRGRK